MHRPALVCVHCVCDCVPKRNPRILLVLHGSQSNICPNLPSVCVRVCVWLCKYVRMCVLASLSYANLIVNSGKNASPEHGEEDRIDRGRGTETAGGCGDS